MQTLWTDLDGDAMEEDVKRFMKTLKHDIPDVDKRSNAYKGLIDLLRSWLFILPLIISIHHMSMRERHWRAICKLVNVDIDYNDQDFCLKDVRELNLQNYSDEIEEITDSARQQDRMERALVRFYQTWEYVEYEHKLHKDSGVQMLRMYEDDFEELEEHLNLCACMYGSKYFDEFSHDLMKWNK